MEPKQCTKCKVVKTVADFNRNKNRKDGLEGICRECRNKQKAQYRSSEQGQKKIKETYWSNVDKERARMRDKYHENKEYFEEYRTENQQRYREHKRKWTENNREYYDIKNHIYFAKKKGLKIDWSKEHHKEVMDLFDGKCALTGQEEGIEMDHFIAISTGHGGTYLGNMLPMQRSLNYSKHKRNPFEWIAGQEPEIQVRFELAVGILADQNGMTRDEFKNFVDWCYENPRSEDEILKPEENSIKLWRQSTAL